MALPKNNRLRAENWNNNPTFVSRLGALQDMEKQLSAQENRPEVPIRAMFDKERVVDENGQPFVSGRFLPDEGENGTITIDPALLADDQPYKAAETYFHEARHAYQKDVGDNPAKHPEIGKEQAALWKKNQEAPINENDIDKGGGEVKFGHYYGQPVEEDARSAARQHTDELYSGQFQDKAGYDPYRQGKLAQQADLEEQSVKELGPDYRQEAKKAVEAKYDAQQDMAQEQAAEQGEKAVEKAGETAVETTHPEAAVVKEAAGKVEAGGEGLQKEAEKGAAVSTEEPQEPSHGEEEGYGYGYGY